MAKNITIASVPATGSLDSRIDAVIKGSNGIAIAIHAVAVECLAHFGKTRINERGEEETCGDLSKAQRLVDGLHSACRPNALRAWFVKYGPISYSAKTNRFTKDKRDDANVLDLSGANASPYFVETKEASVETLLDITKADALFAGVLRRLEKALKDDTVEPASNQAIRNRIDAMKAFAGNGYRITMVAKAEPKKPTDKPVVVNEANADLERIAPVADVIAA